MRWSVFALLFAFTFMAYVQRTSISVAAERMMPELGLSQVQIGWLETAFLVSYTALQFPGGLLGQALGPRLMLTLCGGVSLVAALAPPILPSLATGEALFVALLVSQFVLGMAQGPVFGLITGALERWFPSRQWALTQGVSSGGVGLGAAAAPAAIASLMAVCGWRPAVALVAAPTAVLVWAWWRIGRDTPHQHPGVGADELAELDLSAREPARAPVTLARILRLVADRDLLGLSLAYLAMNFVFYLIAYWSFLYLIQARHFSELAGGLAAAAPPLAGGIGAMIGGVAGSALTARLGAKAGLRVVPLVALPSAALMLLAAVHAGQAGWALAALAAAFGLIETTEASFWAASMEIGRTDAAAAGGLLNTGGNLGGVVATPIVAALSAHGDWNAPFVVGAGFAVVSAALWLLINPGERTAA